MKLKMKRVLSILSVAVLAFAYTGCSKDKDDTPPPPPGGGTGTEGTTPIVYDKDISTSITFKNHRDGVDYEICGNITVSSTLEIEAGVEILMCAGSSITFNENGILKAIGTASEPIIIQGKEGGKGSWGFINIESDTSANILEFVNISNGGGNYKENDPNSIATIFINGNKFGQLAIKNTKISDGKGNGIIVEDGGLISEFSKNTFSKLGGAPIEIPFSNIGVLDEATDYDNNVTSKYINVTEGSTFSSMVINKLNVPYLLNGRNWIYNPVKINPGVDILMNEKTRIYVDKFASLNAIGSSSEPITIDGKENRVGYWDAIRFDSDNSLNEFKFVEIKNGGGYDEYDYSTIYVKGDASFEITQSDISYSYQWAIFAEAGATLTPATKAGLENENTFSNNGSGNNAGCNQRDCNIFIEP